MSDALLLLDLQSDLLSEDGALERPIPAVPLLESTALLLEAARGRGVPVIWIRSHYPTRAEPPPPLRAPRPPHPRFAGVPENSRLLAGGHHGRPCCVAGSPGAALHPAAAALVAPEDLELIKSRYSAFTETPLLDLLEERGIARVYIGGLTTNLGVRATATDAFFHGLDVRVVAECTAASNKRAHREALAAMGKHQVSVVGLVEALRDWSAQRHGLGAGDSWIEYGAIPEERDQDLFQQLLDEVQWEEMAHRGGLVPRKVALQIHPNPEGHTPVYRHPADTHPSTRPYTPTVRRLRDLCAARAGEALNHVLLQYYRSGHDHISAHSDKTLDMVDETDIIGLSFGATRCLVLRSKRPDAAGVHDIQRLELPHGSLYAIGPDTNRRYHHEIRADRRPLGVKRSDERRNGGARISLTLRAIGTFQTHDGLLYGLGARRRTPTAPEPSHMPKAEQAQRMLQAFALENQDTEARRAELYAGGFDVLDLDHSSSDEA